MSMGLKVFLTLVGVSFVFILFTIRHTPPLSAEEMERLRLCSATNEALALRLGKNYEFSSGCKVVYLNKSQIEVQGEYYLPQVSKDWTRFIAVGHTVSRLEGERLVLDKVKVPDADNVFVRYDEFPWGKP